MPPQGVRGSHLTEKMRSAPEQGTLGERTTTMAVYIEVYGKIGLAMARQRWQQEEVKGPEIENQAFLEVVTKTTYFP